MKGQNQTIDVVCGIDAETKEPSHLQHNETTICCDSRDCGYKFPVKGQDYQAICLYLSYKMAKKKPEQARGWSE